MEAYGIGRWNLPFRRMEVYDETGAEPVRVVRVVIVADEEWVDVGRGSVPRE